MIFLRSVRTCIFSPYENHCSPKNNLDTETVAELAELVNHLDPKPRKTVCRFKLNNCNRKAGEPVAEYIAHLGQLATDYDLGGTLNDTLRDRLVCAITDEKIQLKLVTGKETLTVENAMHLRWKFLRRML